MAVLLVFPFCSGKWTLQDRYEGIRGTTLRVYVRIAEFGDNEMYTEEDMKQALLQNARKRCTVLLSCHVRESHRERGADGAAGELHAKIAGTSEIKFFRCRNEYCEAFVDFNVKEILPIARDEKNEQGRSAE
jgi:hypothetical protein